MSSNTNTTPTGPTTSTSQTQALALTRSQINNITTLTPLNHYITAFDQLSASRALSAQESEILTKLLDQKRGVEKSIAARVQWEIYIEREKKRREGKTDLY